VRLTLVDDCSNYETLTLDMLPDVVDKCIRFLQSEAFFLILSNLTGLQLHHLAVVSPDTDDDDDDDDVTPSARGLFTLHISLSRINSYHSSNHYNYRITNKPILLLK